MGCTLGCGTLEVGLRSILKEERYMKDAILEREQNRNQCSMAGQCRMEDNGTERQKETRLSRAIGPC